MEHTKDKQWWDLAHGTMWRLSGRSDLCELMQSARHVARQCVAPLVASGGRSTCAWTADKAKVLKALDNAGLSAIATKSDSRVAMPLAVTVWELAWIDGGAAVCSLSSLAHMIVRDAGTAEQRRRYLDNRYRLHGALCLTEPLPGAGSDASSVEGRIGVSDWTPGQEPILEIEKRGRFTSHMDFAEFVAVAVESRDKAVHGSCMVILEPSDEGLFDRGIAVRKLGHQLSSTTNPEFRLRVPADRILGGYTVEGDAIVPKYSHREALAGAFRRARAVMALATASKLLSVLASMLVSCRTARGDRGRLGELLDLWAAGEAAASLGFLAARLSDDLDSAGAERAALERRAAVVCPAAKLFSTERASALLPIAAAIVGECRALEADGGFVAYKLIDAQLEAAYLGPDAAQRRQISAFMTDPAFLAEFAEWTSEMRQLASPGAVTLAAAMELWSWTLGRLRSTRDSRGVPIFREASQAVTFPMADGLSWLLAARALVLDVLTLPANGLVESFYFDLATIHSAQAAGRVAQLCTGLLFGCHSQGALPNDARDNFAVLRATIDKSLYGVMSARERAIGFVRNLDPAELGSAPSY